MMVIDMEIDIPLIIVLWSTIIEKVFFFFFWLKYDFIQQTNQEQYNPC